MKARSTQARLRSCGLIERNAISFKAALGKDFVSLQFQSKVINGWFRITRQ